MHKLRYLAVTLVVLAACLSDLTVPDGAQIVCAQSKECPSPYVCNTELGLCVSANADAAPPKIEELRIGVVGPIGKCALDVCPKSVFRAGEVALVVFRVASELARQPSVTVVQHGGQRHGLDVLSTSANDFRFALDILPGQPNGFYDLVVEVVDRFGQPDSVFQSFAFEVDTVAPEILTTNIAYFPGAGNPVLHASRMTVGTRAVQYRARRHLRRFGRTPPRGWQWGRTRNAHPRTCGGEL